MFQEFENEYNQLNGNRNDRQTNFLSAAKQIPSRFTKNEKKEIIPLTYDDKVILDINSKLFKDRNAYLESKPENESKSVILKPKKFNKFIIKHIES